MSKQYLVTSQFRGYKTKTDKTKLSAGYLVSGSQNVVSTDGDNIKLRQGYTLFGQANTAVTPIESSFDWDTNTGVERNLRSYDDKLEFYSTDTGQWEPVGDGFGSVAFNYATFWDGVKENTGVDDNLDIMLFVNGGSSIYDWSGAAAKIGVTTSSSIQLLDTSDTWAENRFFVTEGFRTQIIIEDYTALSGATINIRITNAKTGATTDTTLTEGASWNAVTDNDTTATNLALAITGVSGLSSIATLNKVFTTRSAGATYLAFMSVSDPVNMRFDARKKITINGNEYTYKGGEDTDTLTNVSPDPTGEASGSLAIQSVHENFESPGEDSNVFSNDIIATLKNQVWIGSNKNNSVFVSKNTDFTDFSFSSPRLPGEGSDLTLDATTTGFAIQEEDIYISAGKSQWYQSRFTLSDDNLKESLAIKRLNTGSQQGALSQGAIAKTKNSVVFMSNEPTLDSLGRVQNLTTPQAQPLSDSVKPDFDNADLANIHVKYFRNNIYVALPSESKLYIYNIEKGFWEAPWILPVRRLSIIGGELYMHSNSVAETYKLFDGLNDNGNPIKAIAAFSYQNYKDRANLKKFDEFYSEGLISANTKMTLKLNYEFDGFETVIEKAISGLDSDILFGTVIDSSIGKNSLGKEPIGSTTDPQDSLAKFRQINELGATDFYEMQVVYESDQIDGQWEVLAFGGNVKKSSSIQIKIKK